METRRDKNKEKYDLNISGIEEAKDFDNLSFDEERNTFEVDAKDEGTAYDHPLPYETLQIMAPIRIQIMMRRIPMWGMSIPIKLSKWKRS